MSEGSPVFPAAKDDDDDDVAWALSTALVQWKRGSQADAVVWLRRAIDSAVSVGATWRAAELTRQTDTLEQQVMGSGAAAYPFSVAAGAADDFDGTDVIGDEATSLPPDADLSAPSWPPQRAESADEDTEVTAELAEEEDDATEIEPDEDEEAELLEIEEDDISEDELGDDDALPRFASEAPTAHVPHQGFKLPYEEEPEAEITEKLVDPEPSARSEPPFTVGARGVDDAIEVEPEDDVEIEVEPEEDDEVEPEEDDEVEPEEDVATDDAPGPEQGLGAPPSSRPPASELPPEARDALPSELELTSEPDAQPEPELPPPSTQSEPFVAGISLAEIKGFEDFPPETQLSLAGVARVERLATDEEVAGFGLALVLRGSVNVMPTVADVACGSAGERELVYGRGTLPDGVALRLVATAPDTQVAIWSFDDIEPPLADCPWVLEELHAVADRYQALAGVSMGPMGDRLDDALRGMVLSRCRLVKLLPDEVLVEKGKPVNGLYIVGAGRLKLEGSEPVLGPGDFLFAQQILGGGAAPTTARAGAAGALLMVAERSAAHELMLSVPPLLELLAG